MFWQGLRDTINDHPFPVYVVGGFWRDLFLGRSSKDLDLMVMGEVRLLAERLAQKLDATLVTLDENYEIYRLVLKEGTGPFKEIDLAKVQGETCEEDLAKRDFTFNAMALSLEEANLFQLKELVEQGPSEDLENLDLIDPWKGREDLKRGFIRVIQEDTFKRDPIRLLRCGRFMALLGGQVESETLEALYRDKGEINRVAKERVREEIFALLRLEDSFNHLEIISEDWGLLPEIFPIIEVMRKTEQNCHHAVNVWTHCLHVYKALEEMYKDLSFLGDRLQEPLESYLGEALAGKGRTKRELLKIVALFHDMGKVTTKKIKADGRITFYGHDKVGSEEIKELAKSLVLGNKEISWLSSIVKGHMRPLQLLTMTQVTKKAKFKFYKEYGKEVIGILLFSLADLQAKQYFRPKEEEKTKFQKLVKELMEDFLFANDEYAPEKILSGKEILSQYPNMPRNSLGPILGALEEAQVLGLIKDRRDALQFVESIYKE